VNCIHICSHLSFTKRIFQREKWKGKCLKIKK
jgi:hypothetical protein